MNAFADGPLEVDGLAGCTRRPATPRQYVLARQVRINARWSLDFIHDQFALGRRFLILNIVDDVTRECLAAIPDTSISGKRVARELMALIGGRGKPRMIVSDNGTECTSSAILEPGRCKLLSECLPRLPLCNVQIRDACRAIQGKASKLVREFRQVAYPRESFAPKSRIPDRLLSAVLLQKFLFPIRPNEAAYEELPCSTCFRT
jgi:transposase InsO family protein